MIDSSAFKVAKIEPGEFHGASENAVDGAHVSYHLVAFELAGRNHTQVRGATEGQVKGGGVVRAVRKPDVARVYKKDAAAIVLNHRALVLNFHLNGFSGD